MLALGHQHMLKHRENGVHSLLDIAIQAPSEAQEPGLPLVREQIDLLAVTGSDVGGDQDKRAHCLRV
jgi:hypothetical protein